MRQVLSRDMAIALLQGMGCPVDLCQRVAVNITMGEPLSVDISYMIDPESLKKAADILCQAVSHSGNEPTAPADG